LIYSKIAISAFCLVSHGCRQISSPLILARQGYAQHDPERGFEERLDGGVLRFQMISLIISSASQAIFELVTIAFAAHGHLEAILAQDFLVVVGTILRPAVCVIVCRQPTGQRDTHRILAEFVRSFQSHSQSPLVP
jgi:hypothetical protein